MGNTLFNINNLIHQNTNASNNNNSNKANSNDVSLLNSGNNSNSLSSLLSHTLNEKHDSLITPPPLLKCAFIQNVEVHAINCWHSERHASIVALSIE